MSLQLLTKSDLTAAQTNDVEALLASPEQQREWGYIDIPGSWRLFSPDRLFALLDAGQPLGVVTIHGALSAIDPAWWIASSHRGQRIGSKMIDLLAPQLIARGVTDVGRVVILGLHDTQSRRMVEKLRALIRAGAST